jgi:hypothetical protein
MSGKSYWVFFMCLMGAVAMLSQFMVDLSTMQMRQLPFPLCDEALNYCTSTSLVKSDFVDFCRGYILKYEGTKKSKIAKMTLQL